jgi:hypothetical protein
VLFYLFRDEPTTVEPNASASTSTSAPQPPPPPPPPPVQPPPPPPPTPTIPVPNVVGMTAEEASKVLKDAGFVNVKVVLDTNGDGTADGDATAGDMGKTVTDVNPDAGTSVVGTTQIVLTVDGKTGGGLG